MGRPALRALIAAFFAVLSVAFASPVLADEVVYDISLTYDGACEGFTEGQLRVDGSKVELWGSDGGSQQKVGEGIREADDSFVVDVPEAGFLMHGQLAGDTVRGNGTFRFAGSSCGFTFSGRVKGADVPTTTVRRATTTTTEAETTELDPTGEGALTDAEIRSVLQRAGMNTRQVDQFLQQFDNHLSLSHTTFGDEEERAVVLAIELAGLARTPDHPTFPILSTLMQLSDEDCDGCEGPFRHIISGVRHNDIDVRVLNRGVRLALTMDLP